MRYTSWALAALMLIGTSLQAAEVIHNERVYSAAEQDCLLAQLKTARDDVSVGVLREQCRQQAETRTAGEVMRDLKTGERRSERFLIEPHKATYILPLGYQTGATKGFDDQDPTHAEVKYQISFKSKIDDDLLGRDADLYFAYTQQSYWQLYDTSYSSPFRENDYEPEVFVDMPLDWRWRGARFISWRLGAVHQSNGRGPDYSRSWNRVYADFLFEHGDAWLGIKPWWRIPEQAGEDDNADIMDYMGHVELSGGYNWGDQRLTLMTRNWWESNDKGAVQLDYSWPATRYLRWNVQLYNGYGESLLDYDENVSRISFGILLEDGVH